MYRGFYSLIQYCPDLARSEAANIGVILAFPDKPFYEFKLAKTAARIRKFFGYDEISAKSYEALRDATTTKLHHLRSEIKTLDDLVRFIKSRANEIQLSEPRLIVTKDPWQELEDLFDRLVDKEQPKPRRKGVRESLDEELKKPEYRNLVDRQVDVLVPKMAVSITIPYGFQNGRYNLIQPATFPYESGADFMSRTGRFRFESELLYEEKQSPRGPMQLVVVGEFPDGGEDMALRVKRMLEEKHAKFYRAEELPRLIQEIRRTAKPLRPDDSLLPG